MTSMIEDTQEQQVDELSIGSLRKLSSLMQIQASNKWTKDDHIKAIKDKQATLGEVALVLDGLNAPKPGHARVLIHRDPTHGHSNSPVPLSVNGRIITIPRGIECDIPIPFVEVLKNAVSMNNVQVSNPSRDNPTGLYKEEQQTSYPFQVSAITPGQFANQHDSRSRKYEMRKAFYDKYGAWPTSGELKEYQKASIQNHLNTK